MFTQKVLKNGEFPKIRPTKRVENLNVVADFDRDEKGKPILSTSAHN